MAAIIIPRRNCTQPHGRVAVSPQWLTQDALIHCRSVGDFPNVTTGFVQQHTSTEPRFLSEGVRLVADNGGPDDDRFAFLGTFNTAKIAPLTSVVVVSSYATPHLVMNILGGRMGHYAAFTSNTLRIGYAGGNGYDYYFKNADGVIYDAAETSHKTYVFVVSTDPVNKRISVAAAKNGILIPLEYLSGSNTYIGQGTISSQATNPFIGAVSYTNYYHFNGLLRLWAMDYAFVDQSKAEEIAANPWQLFRADPIRIYSLPSGPIIPALSGLTTTNITQSGARHSLTLTF